MNLNASQMMRRQGNNMSNYKITDLKALEEKYPEAVVTVRTANRAYVTRLVKAAKVLGVEIPGVELAPDTLDSIPEQFRKAKDA